MHYGLLIITIVLYRYPLFSVKLFELIYFNRLYDSISNCNLLNDNQFGFRLRRSIIDALTEAMKFYVALDHSRSLLGFFKALDTINSETLMKKFELYGVHRVAWLRFVSSSLIGSRCIRLINCLIWWHSIAGCTGFNNWPITFNNFRQWRTKHK